MELKSNFGYIFWIHLILICFAYLSPILFRWQIIALGVFCLYIQQFILQGCILTHKQFGKDRYMTFYYHYFKLLGFNPNKKKLKILMAWIMPIIVLSIGIFIQEILNFKPLIF